MCKPQIEFKVGKVYIDRKGAKYRITDTNDGTSGVFPIVGESVDDPHDRQCWKVDGQYHNDIEGPRDLIQECPEPSEADRLDKLEAQCTDLFRQLRGIRESRTDGLATLNNGIDDLRQRIEGRFAKAGEEQAADVQQAHNRMAHLSARIASIEKVLPQYTTISGIPRPMYISELERSLAERVGALDERLDATDTWRNQTTARLDNHAERLRNIQDRVCELENYTGLDVRSAPTATNRTTCGHPECGQCYPKPGKPTIKGGWVNFYRTRGVPRIGALCVTKDEADRAADGNDCRLACIRIPDFTEGEGL